MDERIHHFYLRVEQFNNPKVLFSKQKEKPIGFSFIILSRLIIILLLLGHLALI